MEEKNKKKKRDNEFVDYPGRTFVMTASTRRLKVVVAQ